MIKFLKRVLYYIIKKICSVVFYYIGKVDNKKIVFDNFLGRGYGGNPKYICEEIIREEKKYKIVWLLNDMEEELPDKVKAVKYDSISALWELATAKVWIDNVRNYKGINKKKNQFYIQTWHGALGLKKVESEAKNSLSSKYIKQAKSDALITDLMLANNKYMINKYRKAFWYNGKIYEYGVPRNDIIAENNLSIRDKIYSKYSIDIAKKIILYAPTFRSKVNINVYEFDYKKCCEKCSEKFNHEYVFLIKLHPNDIKHFGTFQSSKTIINVSNYPDMQELLSVADIVITDYSSVMFDFSMAHKKVFLYASDFEEYKKNERDIEFDFEELPFDLAEKEDELYKNISKFNEKKYEEKCNAFYKKIGLCQKGNSSKDIVQIIDYEMNR